MPTHTTVHLQFHRANSLAACCPLPAKLPRGREAPLLAVGTLNHPHATMSQRPKLPSAAAAAPGSPPLPTAACQPLPSLAAAALALPLGRDRGADVSAKAGCDLCTQMDGAVARSLLRGCVCVPRFAVPALRMCASTSASRLGIAIICVCSRLFDMLLGSCITVLKKASSELHA